MNPNLIGEKGNNRINKILTKLQEIHLKLNQKKEGHPIKLLI